MPSENRYDTMIYNRCGQSGLKLPAVSLGLWHNFGSVDIYDNARMMVLRAFDLGVTHFNLANNYGPPPGTAEKTFGRILREDLIGYRDELVISTKAGWDMWPGPYGDWGSRKYLVASLDQSLARLGLDYVDIFYHHRPDPETPLEETMGAEASFVSGGGVVDPAFRAALDAAAAAWQGSRWKELIEQAQTEDEADLEDLEEQLKGLERGGEEEDEPMDEGEF